MKGGDSMNVGPGEVLAFLAVLALVTVLITLLVLGVVRLTRRR